MSYFRKSILLFVFMFGVLSGSYAVAALGLEPRPYCTSLEAHVATVIADCKTPQAGAGMAMQGTCRAFNSGNWDDAICAKWNPKNDKNFDGGGIAPRARTAVHVPARRVPIGEQWTRSALKVADQGLIAGKAL